MFCFFCNFSVFAPVRPARPDAYKPNGISCFLRAPGAPGLIFGKNHDFCTFSWKSWKTWFPWFFVKFSSKSHFHQLLHIAKTPVIPKDYQGFWAPGSPKVNIFLKNQDFHEISWNFMKIGKFHDFHGISWISHKKWKTQFFARPDARNLPKPL